MAMMQGKVGLKTVPCYIFLMILLCISLAIILNYRGTGEEAFLNVLIDPSTGEISENQAGLLCINCRHDLNDLLQAFVDSKLRRLKETFSNVINTVGYSSAKENIQNLANVRHPELEQTLFNCIRRNNIIFQISREHGDFYTRYFKSLFRRHDVPRRILAPKDTAEAPDSDLGPSPSPDSDPADSSDSEAPDISTTPTPSKSPASSPPSPLPKPSNQHPLLCKPSNQPPPPGRDPQSNSNPDNRDSDDKGLLNKETIIIACIVTAVLTAFVALLLFLLCFRKQITNWPISGGEKLDHQSLGNKSSLHQKASTDGSINLQMSSDGKSSLEAVAGAAAAAGASKAAAESSDTSGNTNSILPPGRAGSSAPGVPPVNALSVGSDPRPLEPPNPLTTNPPAPPGSASVPRPPGPPPPPKPPGAKSGPHPPAPPGAPPRPPPPMPTGTKVPKPPSGPQGTKNAASGEGSGAARDGAAASKAKLKPFFWDKVAAKPDHAMVWNQIKSGSFQFNEELIETLFGYSAVAQNKNNGKKEPSTQNNAPQYVQLLEPKKAQNIAIVLRALNVTTEEVCDALREGSELPVEILQTLLKMAPTSDEELKLRMFSGEISQLGTAELFLKHLLDIPFAFKRMDALLFMCSLNEEVSATKQSFETLEVACKDLRGSRIFLKLLEAVLKTGNRMNDGTYRGGAQAFKLDTLLKLSDVKGADGKTTLLHFVIQEIIRTEGLKAARVERESRSSASINSDNLLEDVSHDTEEHYRSLGFQAVSRLSGELENVKKAAALDAENLTGTVAKLGHSLLKARDFLNSEMKGSEEDSGFHNTLKSFIEKAEVDVKSLLEEEKRIMELVKYTANYFHGNNQKDEGLRLFVVVRDFLIILNKVCKEVKDKPVKSHKKEGSLASSSSESSVTPPSPDPHQKLFPTIAEQRVEDSSSMSDDKSK